jgi:hypothetical protein
MTLTPTAQSSMLAGFILWLVGWSTFFKADKIPMIGRFVNVESATAWIMENKVLTLLITEIFNFGSHGISNPASTLFAIGGTIFNTLMIFVGLPTRQLMKRRKYRNHALKEKFAA